jgi:hypothetical protein
MVIHLTYCMRCKLDVKHMVCCMKCKWQHDMLHCCNEMQSDKMAQICNTYTKPRTNITLASMHRWHIHQIDVNIMLSCIVTFKKMCTWLFHLVSNLLNPTKCANSLNHCMKNSHISLFNTIINNPILTTLSSSITHQLNHLHFSTLEEFHSIKDIMHSFIFQNQRSRTVKILPWPWSCKLYLWHFPLSKKQ